MGVWLESKFFTTGGGFGPKLGFWQHPDCQMEAPGDPRTCEDFFFKKATKVSSKKLYI